MEKSHGESSQSSLGSEISLRRRRRAHHVSGLDQHSHTHSHTLTHTHREKTEKTETKTKVDELLERTLQSIALLENPTISVSNNRLKCVVEHQHRSPSGSPRRRGLPQDLSTERSLLSTSSASLAYSKTSSWEMRSLGSEFSLSTDRLLTNRELIHDIERRARKGRAAPDYVAPLNELDPSLISWNKRVPSSRKEDPPVNIIGCLHPIELVLAKADQRMRKQTKALQLKQQNCEVRTKAIDDAIKWKFSRAERLTAALTLRQLQFQWLRILQIARFFAVLGPRFRNSFHAEKEFMRIARCANVMKRFVIWWHRKYVFAKFQQRYREAFAKIEATLKRRVRIVRKTRAADRIRQFFTDYKGHHKMGFIVHRYLTSVRKVQARIRSYIQCKYAKIEALSKVWSKLEVQYIRKKLMQRKARIKELNAAKKSNEELVSDLDSKLFIEMKQQAKQWSKIDSRMEQMVQELKHNGVIHEESEEEIIQRLLVPDKMKINYLKAFLEKVRKEFYIRQRNAIRKQHEFDATFKEHHAAQLLRGQTANLERIINERYGHKIIRLKYPPFYMFTNLDRRQIYDRIKECHHICETFKLKVEKFA